VRCDLKPAAMGNTAVAGIYLTAFMKRTGQHCVCLCEKGIFSSNQKTAVFISNLKVCLI